MHPSIRHMKDLDFLELRNLKWLTKSLCSNAQLTVGTSIIIQSPFIIFWTIAACVIIRPLMLSLGPEECFWIKWGQAYMVGIKFSPQWHITLVHMTLCFTFLNFGLRNELCERCFVEFLFEQYQDILLYRKNIGHNLPPWVQ